MMFALLSSTCESEFGIVKEGEIVDRLGPGELLYSCIQMVSFKSEI